MTTSLPVPTADLFRLALGRLATGVSVLTTFAGAHDHAMTANTVTSVSLEPLLVLACVEQDARFHDAITEAGVWGIIILSAAQRPTADWLATQGRPLHGQLERAPHHRGTHTGVVLLDGSLATVECRTTGGFPGGDHTIVVGAALSGGARDHPGEALVYYRRRYTTLA